MGNIGAPELIVIALIVLLLFGAGRIADMGKGLGQGIKNFKKGLKDVDDDVAEAKKLNPADAPAAKALAAKNEVKEEA